ncbi:MAG: tetratricopeptide repeat protein [Terracidiphilus sp.]
MAGLLLAAGLVSTAPAALPAPVSGQKEQLAQANAALQAGEADKALAVLNTLAQPGGSAEAYNLRCRVEYSLEQWGRAANDCEQAVILDGQNSDDHLWLGRALGEKASQASYLTAYSLAKRTRAEFEEAVRLNPRSVEALAALGEFYYSAPGVIGGGIDKSETVAAQLDKIDPVRAHELRGNISEHRKDYGTAERELKQAIAGAPHPAFQWVALASFYRRRERFEEMESAVRSGENAAKRDKRAGVALFNGASILLATNRDPERAAKMLEDYLCGNSITEEGPTFVAHTWLAQLKQRLGDKEAAGRELAAALALAHDYKPALDLNQELKH